jgi:hypothetical protein
LIARSGKSGVSPVLADLEVATSSWQTLPLAKGLSVLRNALAVPGVREKGELRVVPAR